MTEQIPDNTVYRMMAISDASEARARIEDLARVDVRHFAVADLLGPSTARRTVNRF